MYACITTVIESMINNNNTEIRYKNICIIIDRQLYKSIEYLNRYCLFVCILNDNRHYYLLLLFVTFFIFFERS